MMSDSRGDFSIERTVKEPTRIVESAENPEVMTGLDLDPKVIATRGALAPPAGFNPLRPPGPDDTLLAAVPPKRQRSTFRPRNRHLNRLW